MDNQNNVNNDNEAVDPEIFFRAYKEQILLKLGMNELDQSTKDALGDQIDELVNHRILNVILINFPNDRKDELAEKVENDGLDASMSFALEVMPKLRELILNEMYEVQKDIIEKMGKK